MKRSDVVLDLPYEICQGLVNQPLEKFLMTNRQGAHGHLGRKLPGKSFVVVPPGVIVSGRGQIDESSELAGNVGERATVQVVHRFLNVCPCNPDTHEV
ncbi:MAG: hypothetical protein ACE5JX_04850 [Acidobacteriota bacterium]